MSEINNFLSVFRALVIEGGAVAMQHFGNLATIERKADQSPVTVADIEVDSILVEGLTAAFPSIPIITEERAGNHDINLSSGRFFLVDPIDGTREFVNGNSEFTINIALIENGAPVAGAICAPALKLVYWGSVELGAYKSRTTIDAEPQKISAKNSGNTAHDTLTSRSHQTAETLLFIKANQNGTITKAGSSVKFCMLAEGQAGLYPRMGPTMEWDIAAGHAILAAAGGTVLQLDGAPLTYGKPGYRSPWFIAKTTDASFIMPNNLLNKF